MAQLQLRNTILIGGRGRLGCTIATEYKKENIVILDREVYQNWSEPDCSDVISSYFNRHFSNVKTVFIASGLLDPSLPQNELWRINYNLPKNLIDGVSKLGVKVVTFGTTMEESSEKSPNSYIQSKRTLRDYIVSVSSNDFPILHLQIHTLYGRGKPSPFMFLGQILAAIIKNTDFEMTSGRQFREYHHLADEIRAIRKLVKRAPPGIQNMSHGQPLRLEAIAKTVFRSFGKEKLLKLGALPEPVTENYNKTPNCNKFLDPNQFRNTLPAIAKYLRDSI